FGELPPDAQAQGVELDEAVGVALVVDAVLLEGDDVLAVKAVRRAASEDRHGALVELHPYVAGYRLLDIVHQALQGLTFGRVPEAVVDGSRVTRNEVIAQLHYLPVQRQ